MTTIKERVAEFLRHHAATFYDPKRFRTMVWEHGAQGAIIRLINDGMRGKIHEGWIRAAAAGRLEDCTIEAVLYHEPHWQDVLQLSPAQRAYLQGLARHWRATA